MSLSTKKVDEIIDRYNAEESSLLAMMQDIQGEVNYLPKEALERVAQRVKVPIAHLYRIATFFHAFSLEPRGKHVCQVCMGTACHVRGAPMILDEMSRELGVKPGETTKDNQFTLETVNCVGACALGPLVIVNGKYHGKITTADIKEVVDEYREEGCKCHESESKKE